MRRLLLLPLYFAVSYAVIRPITRFRRVNTMERTGVGLEYCPIQKTGSTITHTILCDLQRDFHGVRYQQKFGRDKYGINVCTKRNGFKRNPTQRWRKRSLPVKFAVVRDPVTRYVSLYGHFCLHGNYCGRETTVHRFARDLYNLYRGRRTFRSSKYRTIYEHGLPQTQYCNLRDPDSPINIIYHDDHPMALKEQFMEIFLKAGVPPKFASKALAHISESSSKNALGNHQLKQRLQRAVRENPETMAYIKAIYHFDYEMFDFEE